MRAPQTGPTSVVPRPVPERVPSPVTRAADLTCVCAALLVGACFLFIARGAAPAPVASNAGDPNRTDIALIAAELDRVRAGEPYYAAAIAEITSRGYQHSSPLNFRLPTLAWLEAALPSLWIAQVVLLGLGLATAWMIHAQLPPSASDHRLAALAAAGTMLPVWLTPRIVVMHEVWAGTLIALSVAVWRKDKPLLSVIVGLMACLIRELAVLYLATMFTVSLFERRRRAAIVWAAAIVVVAAALVVHARMVSGYLEAGPTNGWLAFGGLRFVLASARANPLALLLPGAALAIVVPVAVAGLWRWRHPARLPVAATVSTFAVFFLFVGRPDNWYWGFLVAPLWPFGLIGFTAAARSALSTSTR